MTQTGKGEDHILNNGPTRESSYKISGRETRRLNARLARMGKKTIGRDQQFQNEFQPKSRRFRDDNK